LTQTAKPATKYSIFTANRRREKKATAMVSALDSPTPSEVFCLYVSFSKRYLGENGIFDKYFKN
jgi:hypothetical protein